MISRFKYWSVYTIFRWQFILLAVAMWLVYQWLVYNIKITGTDDWLRINDWLNVIFWATAGLMGFSILTLLAAFLVMRYRIRRGKTQVNVSLPGDHVPQAGIVTLEATIKNVLRPILGTVELRIIFPDWKISDRIILDENKRTWFSPFNTVSGKAELDLHNRGLHRVEEVQIVLTDMMKLICIPITLHSQNKLLTLPRELKEEEFKIFPTATEEQDIRINIPKRVQGEFLSYKDFESGDDIRRIVWKIYARTGDLIVRIPETRDPYASHVYVCLGFYNELIDGFNDVSGRELLNVYKDYLRQVYEAVKRNQYSVRLIKDQEMTDEPDADVEPDIYFISTAHWQKDETPSEIFDTPKAAVICLSSAVPSEEVERLFSKLPMHVPVIVFGLSSAFGKPFRFSPRKLFFKDKKHPLNEVRRTWWISPLRKKLQMNEERIRGIVNQRGNAWMMQLQTNE